LAFKRFFYKLKNKDEPTRRPSQEEFIAWKLQKAEEKKIRKLLFSKQQLSKEEALVSLDQKEEFLRMILTHWEMEKTIQDKIVSIIDLEFQNSRIS